MIIKAFVIAVIVAILLALAIIWHQSEVGIAYDNAYAAGKSYMVMIYESKQECKIEPEETDDE